MHLVKLNQHNSMHVHLYTGAVWNPLQVVSSIALTFCARIFEEGNILHVQINQILFLTANLIGHVVT